MAPEVLKRPRSSRFWTPSAEAKVRTASQTARVYNRRRRRLRRHVVTSRPRASERVERAGVKKLTAARMFSQAPRAPLSRGSPLRRRSLRYGGPDLLIGVCEQPCVLGGGAGSLLLELRRWRFMAGSPCRGIQGKGARRPHGPRFSPAVSRF